MAKDGAVEKLVVIEGKSGALSELLDLARGGNKKYKGGIIEPKGLHIIIF